MNSIFLSEKKSLYPFFTLYTLLYHIFKATIHIESAIFSVRVYDSESQSRKSGKINKFNTLKLETNENYVKEKSNNL